MRILFIIINLFNLIKPLDLCSDVDTITTILTRLIFIRADYCNNLLHLYLQYRYQSAYFFVQFSYYKGHSLSQNIRASA